MMTGVHSMTGPTRRLLLVVRFLAASPAVPGSVPDRPGRGARRVRLHDGPAARAAVQRGRLAGVVDVAGGEADAGVIGMADSSIADWGLRI